MGTITVTYTADSKEAVAEEFDMKALMLEQTAKAAKTKIEKRYLLGKAAGWKDAAEMLRATTITGGTK